MACVRLPEECSIFTAELTAIDRALKHCVEIDENLFVVCSDSRSALAAIVHMNSKHPIVTTIQSTLIQLQENSKQIEFCWVPSHVGVQENEFVDEAARSVIDNIEIEQIGIPHKDLYPLIKKKMKDSWQTGWGSLQSNKLREIKDEVIEWASSSHRIRMMEVVLSRLRIGHTLTTHGHLMEGSAPPLCPHCGEGVTVKHILVECPGTERQRISFYGTSTVTLATILKHVPNFNIDKLMGYLNAIDFKEI